MVTTALTDSQMARAAKALSHPARVAILRTLSERPCICGEIVDELPLAQSTVSQHLKVLRSAGLVTGVEDGPRCCYQLDHEGIRSFRLALDLLMERLEGAPCCSC